MGLIIEDGKGTGQTAGVNSENMLLTKCVTEETQQHVNEVEGESFSIVIDRATDGGNQQFFYMKNESDNDLFVTSIKGFVSADTEIKVLLGVTGTATSATDIVPVNRNAGKGEQLSGDFQIGNDLSMTGGDTVDLIKFIDGGTDSQGSVKFSWGSTLILPKNSTFCLESSAAATINLTISCHLHSH